MFSLWVTLEVIPEHREEFLEAIAENSRKSVSDEAGCYRFDVVELGGHSNRFAFYEVYRDQDAFENEHKKAEHYFKYREISQKVVVPGSQVNVSGVLINSYSRPE
ncbi:hypothetical protein AS038_09875 [Arthrobacter sp. NIO-1057]|nr:hypothetical protein AS038_09875 [Arthrobacter sp. NIO-1057]